MFLLLVTPQIFKPHLALDAKIFFASFPMLICDTAKSFASHLCDLTVFLFFALGCNYDDQKFFWLDYSS